MKSERRHELQQNALDQKLSSIVEFLKQRANIIGWAVLILALIVFVVVFAVNKHAAKQTEYQRAYDELAQDVNRSPEERIAGLKDLANQDSNKLVAALANLTLGNEYVSRAIANTDPAADAARKENLDDAARSYKRVIADFPQQRAAVAQAHMGLARIAETQRNFDTAASEYDLAAKAAPVGSPMVKVIDDAKQNLDNLKQPVRMATTSSAPAASMPAPATQPAPAASKPAPARAATTQPVN